MRFYERAGLLSPDDRTAGNYRRYTSESVERLRFIRSAQSVGLSVKDVSELLRLTDADESPCADVEKLLQRQQGGPALSPFLARLLSKKNP